MYNVVIKVRERRGTGLDTVELPSCRGVPQEALDLRVLLELNVPNRFHLLFFLMQQRLCLKIHSVELLPAYTQTLISIGSPGEL